MTPCHGGHRKNCVNVVHGVIVACQPAGQGGQRKEIRSEGGHGEKKIENHWSRIRQQTSQSSERFLNMKLKRQTGVSDMTSSLLNFLKERKPHVPVSILSMIGFQFSLTLLLAFIGR